MFGSVVWETSCTLSTETTVRSRVRTTRVNPNKTPLHLCSVKAIYSSHLVDFPELFHVLIAVATKGIPSMLLEANLYARYCISSQRDRWCHVLCVPFVLRYLRRVTRLLHDESSSRVTDMSLCQQIEGLWIRVA